MTTVHQDAAKFSVSDTIWFSRACHAMERAAESASFQLAVEHVRRRADHRVLAGMASLGAMVPVALAPVLWLLLAG